MTLCSLRALQAGIVFLPMPLTLFLTPPVPHHSLLPIPAHAPASVPDSTCMSPVTTARELSNMDVAAFIKSFQSRAAAPLPPQSIGELIDNVRRQVKGEGGPEGGGPLLPAGSLSAATAGETAELLELLDEGLVSGEGGRGGGGGGTRPLGRAAGAAG